ncbi:MAG: cobalamin-binding protein [Bdellovibrionia bacterium]
MKVVSMIASSTEIICSLDCEKMLVGISHECDFPPSILHLPVTTEVKFMADGKSYDIDQKVKAILQEGLSVYRVKGDLLKDLRPDVIVTQIQCEVCAVSRKDVEAATCGWLEFQPEIVSLEPNCLEDLWTDISKVAVALHVPEKGHLLIERLKKKLYELKLRADSYFRKGQKKPRIACIEWMNPLMAAGNWVPELVELAGGENLFGHPGKHSPWMTWEDLEQADPDIIVVMPCGFGIARSETEMFNLIEHPSWKTLTAVKRNEIFIADGNAFFNRPGPRLIDSLEILIDIFYSASSPKRNEGKGWIRVIPC